MEEYRTFEVDINAMRTAALAMFQSDLQALREQYEGFGFTVWKCGETNVTGPAMAFPERGVYTRALAPDYSVEQVAGTALQERLHAVVSVLSVEPGVVEYGGEQSSVRSYTVKAKVCLPRKD